MLLSTGSQLLVLTPRVLLTTLLLCCTLTSQLYHAKTSLYHSFVKLFGDHFCPLLFLGSACMFEYFP